MLRWGFALALVLAGAGASAASYDDFSQGVNALNRGDADAAITNFTAALKSGDLAASYLPTAYLSRARAYLSKDRCAEALADLDSVITLRSDSVEAYVERAGANVCLGKNDAAVADFQTAVRLRPSTFTFETFGRYQWRFGHFAEAAQNYAHAVELVSDSAPHGPYLVLWYAMSADRAGSLDQQRLTDFARKLDRSDWPVPLLDLYRGKSTVEEVNKEALDHNEKVAANQKCEADFYVAEWEISRRNQGAAKSLLQQAVNECPHTFVEYFAAQTELKRQQ